MKHLIITTIFGLIIQILTNNAAFSQVFRETDDRAEVLMSEAKDFENKGEYEKAEQLYKQILDGHTTTRLIWQVISSYAQMYENKGNLDKAMEIYEMGIEKSGYLWRLRVKTEDDITQALKYHEELLKKYPESNFAGIVQFIIGRIYEHKSTRVETYTPKFSAAIDAYRKIITSYPDAVFTYTQVPFCEEGYLDWVNAEGTTFIAPIAQLSIAAIYENELEDYKQAKKEYENLVWMLDSEKNSNAYFDREWKRNKFTLLAKYKIAEMLESIGEYDEAIELYMQIGKEFPDTKFYLDRFVEVHTEAEAYFKAAQNCIRKTDYDCAINNYKTVIRRFPNAHYSTDFASYYSYASDAIENIANICIKYLKNTSKAINECRGILAIITEKEKEVMKDNWDNIYELKLLKSQTQYKIAEIYEKELENIEQAIVEYNKVVEIAPDEIVEEDVNEGAFSGVYLTYMGKAKYRAEELNSLMAVKIPYLSIFYHQKEYLWDKAYCVVDYPKYMSFCSWQYLARKSRLMRNEIFARHGYIFESPDLKKIYEVKVWYKPDSNFTPNKLNEIEKKNIQYLKKFEEMVEAKKTDEEIKLMLDREIDGE